MKNMKKAILKNYITSTIIITIFNLFYYHKALTMCSFGIYSIISYVLICVGTAIISTFIAILIVYGVIFLYSFIKERTSNE